MTSSTFDQIAKKIKLYSDGADLATAVEMANQPYIAGITTNPTLMRKANVADYREFAQALLKQVRKIPVSFEVFADDFAEMKRQALEISSWAANVYVKIPVTNSTGAPSFDLIHDLAEQRIKLNVTAILAMSQVEHVCAVLSPSVPAIVSVFAGRIADTGRCPKPFMIDARAMCKAVSDNVELLWASSREPLNIVQAIECGCNIITVFPDMLVKAKAMFGMDLGKLSLETVRTFKADAENAGYSL